MHPLPGGGVSMPAVGGGEGEKVHVVHVDAPHMLVRGCAGGGCHPWLSPGACPSQGVSRLLLNVVVIVIFVSGGPTPTPGLVTKIADYRGAAFVAVIILV